MWRLGANENQFPILQAPAQFSTTENENLSVFKKLQYSDNKFTQVKEFAFVDYFPQETLDCSRPVYRALLYLEKIKSPTKTRSYWHLWYQARM